MCPGVRVPPPVLLVAVLVLLVLDVPSAMVSIVRSTYASNSDTMYIIVLSTASAAHPAATST